MIELIKTQVKVSCSIDSNGVVRMQEIPGTQVVLETYSSTKDEAVLNLEASQKLTAAKGIIEDQVRKYWSGTDIEMTLVKHVVNP
jgi:hypothetical protein